MTFAEFARPFQFSENVTDANIRRDDGTYVYVPLVENFEIPTSIAGIIVRSVKLDVLDGHAMLVINEPEESAVVTKKVIDAIADKILEENRIAMEVLA